MYPMYNNLPVWIVSVRCLHDYNRYSMHSVLDFMPNKSVFGKYILFLLSTRYYQEYNRNFTE